MHTSYYLHSVATLLCIHVQSNAIQYIKSTLMMPIMFRFLEVIEASFSYMFIIEFTVRDEVVLNCIIFRGVYSAQLMNCM